MVSSLGGGSDLNKAPSSDALNKKGEVEKFGKLCRQGEGNGDEDKGNRYDT